MRRSQEILETHSKRRLRVGSLELQNLTEAEIGHSNALPFKYGEHKLGRPRHLKRGQTSKSKPYLHSGHTDESLCYIVYPPESAEASSVFTGDTLFAGSVGRTDLYGKAASQPKPKNSSAAYMRKSCCLATTLLVYPAHGAGSVCGHGISGQNQPR